MKMCTLVEKLLAIVVLLLVSTTVQSETYYFHNDQLGTPKVVTDSAQQVAWKGEYDPFGKVTETVALVEQNIRFSGQYLDRETELHYNYFRTYDPNIGRYMESDPIGLSGGRNTYLYASANSISYVDPRGLFAVCKRFLLDKITEVTTDIDETVLQRFRAPVPKLEKVSLGPDLSPPDEPRRWRSRMQPRFGPEWSLALVEYEFTKWLVKTFEITKTTAFYKSFCEETKCGETIRSTVLTDEVLYEDKQLLGIEKFWTKKRVRILSRATF